MHSSTKVGVLSVEDNHLVADAIERKLAGDPRFEWLGWFESYRALRSRASTLPPAVLVADQSIPGEDAFEMLRALRREAPHLRVLVLTGHCNRRGLELALEAGVHGYLSKAEESRLIVQAIWEVGVGKYAFDRELLAARSNPLSGGAAAIRT